MMRGRWLGAGLWVVATALATVVGFLIVGAVSGRVITADLPAPAATATGVEARPTTTASFPAVSSTTATTALASTATTTPPVTRPTTATTAEPPPPTTAPPATERATYTMRGGILSVACTGASIALESATPDDGYRLRVDRTGPDRVEVRFESDDGGSRAEVRCVDGRPSPDIEAESGSGSGGGGPGSG